MRIFSRNLKAKVQKDKIETLIGFALKANKVIFGKDNIEVFRKRMHLIVIDNTLSEKSKKDALFLASNKHIPVLITSKPLEEIIYKQNCKMIALKDKQMSEAIKMNINENYELIVVEVKI